MTRRLLAVAAATAALALLGAPGARAEQHLEVQDPKIACAWAFDLGVCVENPIRRLP
jgi:hypothetical protein